MTDDRSGQQSPLDVDPFQTWVESLSASKGASREEVLEQLVSSYWTLHELLQVIEESGDGGELYPPPDDPAGSLPGPGEAALGGPAGTGVADGEVDRLDERVDALAERTEQRLDALSDGHDDLESRVDAEFDNIRMVLEYLIETTDGLAERIDAVLTDVERARRRRRDERQALVALKREAGRHGVTTAVCGHCETSVAIGTLATPRCPQCESTFDGVVPKTGWFDFGASRLATCDDPPPAEPADGWPAGASGDDGPSSGDRSGSVRGSADEATGGPGRDDRFEWLDGDELP